MTSRTLLAAGIGMCLATGGCGSEEDAEQRAADIITARTVGLAYLEENRLEEAELEFSRLIELAPDEALGYANLGLVYLRMNRYDEAEEQLREALALNPNDPNIHLLLAEVYKVTDRGEAAVRQLETSLQRDSRDVKTLYSLATVYLDRGTNDGRMAAEQYLGRVVAAAPANIAARLQLAEVLVRNGRADSAVAQLEEVRRQVPELPAEGSDFFYRAVDFLRSGNSEQAVAPTAILHNFMKVTPRYQQGLLELQGPGGAAVGFPIITFTQNISTRVQDPETVLAALRFTDATEPAGLLGVGAGAEGRGTEPGAGTHVAVGDYDGDGDQDIFVVNSSEGAEGAVRHLFRNEFGRFEDVSSQAGLPRSGAGTGATFADHDNDGYLDLFVPSESGNALYRNTGDGRFSDVTRDAQIAAAESPHVGLFVDVDHDGDLDLYLANSGTNRVFRNNLDGSFTEQADRMGLSGGVAISRDVAMADFDEDGDIDLFVANQDAASVLYSNLRQGRFSDVTNSAGIAADTGHIAVAVGDYDNDGFSDLFLTGARNAHALYRNRGDGTFEPQTFSNSMRDALRAISGFDADFFDFDNDGLLDLVVVGTSALAGGRGAVLLRNTGSGAFEDHSRVLPDSIPSAVSVALADYNEDGDIDLFVGEANGGVRLLRNDGGNANHYLKIQLVGLTAGSGKNNHFGIGAKLEIRAGDLYQTHVVTSPLNHFGLGTRLKADVVRIVWTNGVPQNLFFPGSDQDLVEQQVLKGSCGFLYAWNGDEYEFVKDMVWKSAIGMPMGIMAGRRTYAPSEPSREYLKVPGRELRPKDGRYSLQITEELWETLYLDEVRLIAVDHPDSIDIYVDEKFVPPTAELPQLELYRVAGPQRPRSAVDDRGNDVLPQLIAKDDVYVSDLRLTRYQGVTEMHDLVLDLGSDLSPEDPVILFLDGWIFPTDASINVAISQSELLQVTPPFVQVPDASGNWVTVIENMSFPMGKNKTVVVDLTDKFKTDERRVRIRTNMQIYWDRVFFVSRRIEAPVSETVMEPASGDLHYRGFSRMYRKGGRYGPHWFDYSDVSSEPKWIDLAGYYTRYGDVTELLREPDSRYVILNAGDELSVEFDGTTLPDLPSGWTRDYLVYSTGWLKDGDLNTAAGQTVDPLPFHGMSQYPYGPDEAYPNDQAHQRYLRDYHTRKVVGHKIEGPRGPSGGGIER